MRFLGHTRFDVMGFIRAIALRKYRGSETEGGDDEDLITFKHGRCIRCRTMVRSCLAAT